MDEIAGVKYSSPWKIEDITNDSMLYRQVHHLQTVGKKSRRVPNETHFALRTEDIFLSFNWNKYISPATNFKLIGISKSKKMEWLNPKEFSIFQYPVEFLNNLDQVKIITHDPVYDEQSVPSPVGKPNNRAHSAVYCNGNDLKFRTIMADYCNDHYEAIKCDVDKGSIMDDVQALRKRGNDTPYHREWKF